MSFRDRTDAGERLARALAGQGLEKPVVLAIPRGGVPVAAPIARTLGAVLGVVVARKIGAPLCPELAIGATTANGATVVDARLARRTGADEGYVRAAVAREVEEARRREAAFNGRKRPALAGREVVLVDDGIATGATVVAAARAVRLEGALRIVIAVPVASPRALERLESEADSIVCLVRDDEFEAVGPYYDDFHQLDDDEVRSILDAHVVAA